jgi:hypothetical protein
VIDGDCKHGVLVEHNRERGGVNRECVLCINEAGRALFDRMASMLRELEWAGNDGRDGDGCPICGASTFVMEQGPRPGFGQHEPDCRLAALLSELT